MSCYSCLVLYVHVLTDLFKTIILKSYKQEMSQQKLKRKYFQNIVKNSPYYQNEQTWELQLRRLRAKCSSNKCDKDLKSGLL